MAAAFTVIALISSACAAPSGEPQAWITLPGREVAVLHHAGDEFYATRVLDICERRAPTIAASMGLTTLSPMRAMIASNDEEFAELTHHGVPDWGVGCALTNEGLVVLKSPRIVDYPLQMETVVEHELAHIAAGRVLRGITVPQWFQEGIAQTVAGEWRLSESGGLARAAATGNLPDLSELVRVFPASREAASTAYAMSFQAVRLLMERSGARTPGQLVAAISASGDFDAAVFGLTGWRPEQFDVEYRRFISRRFNLGTIIADDRLLFAGLALVFIAVVVVRLARSRRRLREWEEEERRGLPAAPRDAAPRDSSWS